MGFDLISVLLNLAGIFLGLTLLVSRLLASREMDVRCALHDESA